MARCLTRAKYGDIREAVGFTYDEKLNLSVVFKPKAEVIVQSY